MVRCDWYRQAMKEAGIPISRYEDEIIKNIEQSGKFDENRYVRKVRMETPVYITDNQYSIIRMLSFIENAVREVGRKNGVKKQVSRKKGRH